MIDTTKNTSLLCTESVEAALLGLMTLTAYHNPPPPRPAAESLAAAYSGDASLWHLLWCALCPQLANEEAAALSAEYDTATSFTPTDEAPCSISSNSGTSKVGLLPLEEVVVDGQRLLVKRGAPMAKLPPYASRDKFLKRSAPPTQSVEQSLNDYRRLQSPPSRGACSKASPLPSIDDGESPSPIVYQPHQVPSLLALANQANDVSSTPFAPPTVSTLSSSGFQDPAIVSAILGNTTPAGASHIASNGNNDGYPYNNYTGCFMDERDQCNCTAYHQSLSAADCNSIRCNDSSIYSYSTSPPLFESISPNGPSATADEHAQLHRCYTPSSSGFSGPPLSLAEPITYDKNAASAAIALHTSPPTTYEFSLSPDVKNTNHAAAAVHLLPPPYRLLATDGYRLDSRGNGFCESFRAATLHQVHSEIRSSCSAYHDLDQFALPPTRQKSGVPRRARVTLLINTPNSSTRLDLLRVFRFFGPVVPTVVCRQETRHPNKEWSSTAGYSFIMFCSPILAALALKALTSGKVVVRHHVVNGCWAKNDSVMAQKNMRKAIEARKAELSRKEAYYSALT